LKSFSPGKKIPQGLLSQGAEALRSALGNFENARTIDKVNERRPPISVPGEV